MKKLNLFIVLFLSAGHFCIAQTAANNDFAGDAKLMISAFTNENGRNDVGLVGPAGIPVFTNSKQTIGHRFVFTKWVHGEMVKANGDIIKNADWLYNYDKIKGDLFITQDRSNVTLADKAVIKAFNLTDDGKTVSFEKMTGISDDRYCIVISKGSKYKIYKLLVTKFTPNNFTTNGISSSGNDYDEFTDNNTYYIQNLTTGNFQLIALKKKAIQKFVTDENDKMAGYMSAHADEPIDDSYLAGLGNVLNN